MTTTYILLIVFSVLIGVLAGRIDKLKSRVRELERAVDSHSVRLHQHALLCEQRATFTHHDSMHRAMGHTFPGEPM